MQKLTLALLLALVLCGISFPLHSQSLIYEECKQISDIFIAKLEKNPKIKNIGVVDFTNDKGQITPLGKYLSTQFYNALMNSNKRFTVIDRSQLNALFQENNLRESGLLNAGEGSQLGRLKGIDAIVSGTTQEFSNYIILNVKIIELETGTALDVASGRISKTPSVINLIKEDIPEGDSIVVKRPKPIYNFKRDDLIFNVTDCRKIGNFIECKMEITNTGRKNIDLYVYANDSKAMNKEGGYDYNVCSISLSGKTSSSQVVKTIPLNSFVIAVIDFSNVIENATTLSIIQLNCWTSDTGSFKVEIPNVRLNP